MYERATGFSRADYGPGDVFSHAVEYRSSGARRQRLNVHQFPCGTRLHRRQRTGYRQDQLGGQIHWNIQYSAVRPGEQPAHGHGYTNRHR